MKRPVWKSVLLAAALLGGGHAAASAPPAQARDAGTAVVVGSGRGAPIDGGASSTVFSLDLPDDAMCPGDSANDQWRVQTFLLPVGVDPGAIEYSADGPEVEGAWSLYRSTSEPVSAELLEDNGEPGKPGRFSPIQDLSMFVFDPTLLPPGTYTIGVICTLFRAPGPFWDTEIEVVADAGDVPGGFTWRVTVEQPVPNESAPSGLYAGGALVAAVAGAFGLRAWRRRSAAASPNSTRIST